MDCSPPGFSVHGISQARILEWVAFSSSSGSSWSRDQTFVSFVSCIVMQILYHWPTGEAQTNNHCTLMKLESSWRKSIVSIDTKIKYQKQYSFYSHTYFLLLHSCPGAPGILEKTLQKKKSSLSLSATDTLFCLLS